MKSFDPDQLHPSMIKRLPPTVVNILHKIFNLCLTQGIWIWDSSNVIFLKKVGKSNYMKAGSYRPITMASFVGKIMERILERRLRQHCEFYDLLDDEQEGFRAGRNTTRYLYKLVANLKEAQRRKFTTFLLCLDFEKAFDSVWLKGLIVKLHAWNINGKFLGLINSYLLDRKVILIINKAQGISRKCGEYGVPQGSVLSPLLFIMFISDMFKSNIKEYSSIFKYADDGSVAIIHEDIHICNSLAQEVCNNLTIWCYKWRMIVNCDKDKTECLIILPKKHASNISTTTSNLFIAGKKIEFAKSTSILGLEIDDKLNFQNHANKKVQQCWFAWFNITKNCTRYRGLNISSLVILFKTVVSAKLFYAAPVWLNTMNQQAFRSLYAKACLKISGATHYAPQDIIHVATGLEPLILQYKLICTKFILKALSSDDSMKALLYQLEESKQHPFHYHLQLAKTYLESRYSNVSFGSRRAYSSIAEVNPMLLRYSVYDIQDLKDNLWKEYLSDKTSSTSKNNFDVNSISSMLSRYSPDPWDKSHVSKHLFPRSSRRSTDTKTMGVLHGHDLSFASFKHTVGLAHSAMCTTCDKCDNNIHQVLECPKFNCEFRNKLKELVSNSFSMVHGILISANREQIKCFRNLAQIIIKL